MSIRKTESYRGNINLQWHLLCGKTLFNAILLSFQIEIYRAPLNLPESSVFIYEPSIHSNKASRAFGVTRVSYVTLQLHYSTCSALFVSHCLTLQEVFHPHSDFVCLSCHESHLCSLQHPAQSDRFVATVRLLLRSSQGRNQQK